MIEHAHAFKPRLTFMQIAPQKPRVVILGAGFGGLTAAKAMADFADVTVIDRHNFQTFLPLLYQVSTAGLAADHVAHPIRSALRKITCRIKYSCNA